MITLTHMNFMEITTRLHNYYSNPKTELENWENPIQFMVSVILSAQATDKGVNKATVEFFKHYKTAQDFANEEAETLSKYVSTINFYNSKVDRLIKACQYLIQHHNGEMPRTIEELVKVPGLGRKSANVILHVIYGITEGIVVDTHVSRVALRLGLTKHADKKDAEKIEVELMNIIDKKEWIFFSAATVLLGRYICKAKKPDCTNCPLNDICPSAFRV
ncbi:MAG: endonuclease [Patescibacteria group bacterium]|nr:endonuclease [Patescibacteria group bacterium]